HDDVAVEREPLVALEVAPRVEDDRHRLGPGEDRQPGDDGAGEEMGSFRVVGVEAVEAAGHGDSTDGERDGTGILPDMKARGKRIPLRSARRSLAGVRSPGRAWERGNEGFADSRRGTQRTTMHRLSPS